MISGRLSLSPLSRLSLADSTCLERAWVQLIEQSVALFPQIQLNLRFKPRPLPPSPPRDYRVRGRGLYVW